MQSNMVSHASKYRAWPRPGMLYLCPVGVVSRLCIVQFDCFAVIFYCRGPVVLLEGIVTLVLQFDGLRLVLRRGRHSFQYQGACTESWGRGEEVEGQICRSGGRYRAARKFES